MKGKSETELEKLAAQLHALISHEKDVERIVTSSVDLIKDGADVNKAYELHKAPMILACKRGLVPVVQLFLTNNASLDCLDDRKRDPLSIAVLNADIAIIDIILAHMVKKSSKFLLASFDLSMLKKILNEKLSTKIDKLNSVLDKKIHQLATEFLQHPLTAACKYNMHEIAALLLTHGAASDELSPRGEAAIIQAVKSRHIDMVKLLIANKANLAQTNKKGEVALFKAVQYGNIQIVELLLESMKNIAITDDHGDNAWLKAAECGHIKILNQLLSHDVSKLHSINSQGNNLLLKAIMHGELEMVKLLLAMGLDINTVNFDGDTVLIKAAENDNIAVMKYLIWQRAGLNNQNKAGDTALIKAVKGKHFRAAKLLLEKGADLALINKKKESALTIATHNKDQKLINLLQTYEPKSSDSKVDLSELNADIDIDLDKGEECTLILTDSINYVALEGPAIPAIPAIGGILTQYYESKEIDIEALGSTTEDDVDEHKVWIIAHKAES